MAGATKSASQQDREAGNASLEASSAGGLSHVLREKHLQLAIQAYNRAVAKAARPDEWFSAHKNLSLAHKRWADLLVARAGEAEVIGPRLSGDQERVIFQFREALGAIKTVLQNQVSPASILGDEWVAHLIDRANKTYKAYLDWALDRSTRVQDAVALLRRIYPCLPTQGLCMQCRYDEAETIFVICTRQISPNGLRAVGNYRDVLAQLPNCEMPLREAASSARRVGNIAKYDACTALLESVQVELCVAKASQAIAFGDAGLKMAVHDFESLNMDGIWDAVDHYREAILQARDKDIENEARAYSHLGMVYKDVLKINSAAKSSFSRCMELAKTLMPRNLHGIPWFDKAAAALEAYQAENAHRCDADAQKEKQPFLNELKPELNAFKDKADEGAAALLEHIYRAHPPVTGDVRDASADLKKQVLNAIRHYHPDRASKTRSTDTRSAHEAKKWAVLCEEITKELNGIWDKQFKS
jgi:hypothetical protein